MFASKLKCCLLHATRDAGEILRSRFGRLVRARRKENRASIVSAADLAAEREIIRRLRREFPAHGIIAEESGHQAGTDVFTWVIDPLDGTSNFVAGLPWFGVQIAVFHHQQPVLAALHLPMDGTLYVAEAGHGTFRNGQPVHVSTARKPADVLCAFGMDATGSRRQLLADARLLTRVAGAVRNVRATNSLVDFCCTADGRLGACINLNTKIWDIAPAWLALREAGGRMTGLDGQPLRFALGPRDYDRNYGVLAASRVLHPQLLHLVRPSAAKVSGHPNKTVL